MRPDKTLQRLVEITEGQLICGGVNVKRAEIDLDRLQNRVDDVALEILTAGESAALQSLGHDSRRLEWLGGRLGAKLLVAGQCGVGSLREVEICPDMWGAPLPHISSHGSNDERLPSISISHSQGKVVAAMLPGWLGARLGIDVEKVKPRSPSFIKRVFTAEERAQLEAEGFDQCGLILRWSLKEAAFKALGLGLFDLAPGDVEVTSLSPHGEASMTLRGKAEVRFQALGGTEIIGHGLIDGDHSSAECVVKTGCSTTH